MLNLRNYGCALTLCVTSVLPVASFGQTNATARQESALNAAPVIEKPTADVPANCAGLVGGWIGDWPYIGKAWFWVVGVDVNCVVKYSYGISSAVPTKFQTAEVKNGIVVIPRTKGATTFELKGDNLLGTYSGSDGNNRTTMRRIQLEGNSLAELRAEQNTFQSITPPAADVPASCAPFSGKWTGRWGYGIGEMWLWVASIDAKCMAKIAYLGSSRTPTGYETIEIKNGVLEWLCNRSTSGTCYLQPHGDELWANYSNPAGGRNNAVFTKIQ